MESVNKNGKAVDAAEDLTYDNSSSELAATDVQEAIDETNVVAKNNALLYSIVFG